MTISPPIRIVAIVGVLAAVGALPGHAAARPQLVALQRARA